MRKTLGMIFGLFLILFSIVAAADSNSSLEAKYLTHVSANPIQPASPKDNTAGISYGPDVAVSGNNVYVVWFQPVHVTRFGYDNGSTDNIFFKRSTDNGMMFRNTLNLGNNAKPFMPARILAYGNAVYVLWTSADNKILFRKSTDNGMTFGTPVIIGSYTAPRNSDYFGFETVLPQLAAFASNVYIVWPYGNTLFFRSSTDNGATFGNPFSLTNDVAHDHEGSVSDLSSAGNNVYIVWADWNGSTFFQKSMDKGRTFANPVNLQNPAAIPTSPHLAYVDENVYVVWTTLGGEVFFTASKDNGATFVRPYVIDNRGFPLQVAIAASDSNVYVAESGGIFIKSKDSGTTFGRPQLGEPLLVAGNVSPSLGVKLLAAPPFFSTARFFPTIARAPVQAPQLIASGNNVYLVFLEGQGGNIPIFVKSTDNGATFGSQLLGNQIYYSSPMIAASGNNVYLVTEIHSGGSSVSVLGVTEIHSKVDILFTKSTDRGTTFPIKVNLSDNSSSVSPIR